MWRTLSIFYVIFTQPPEVAEPPKEEPPVEVKSSGSRSRSGNFIYDNKIDV